MISSYSRGHEDNTHSKFKETPIQQLQHRVVIGVSLKVMSYDNDWDAASLNGRIHQILLAMPLPATGIQETPIRAPHQKLEGHTQAVWGAIHLSGGQRIITCSEDGSLRLWNLENKLQIGKDWQDGNGAVKTIASSPDGKTVVSGSGYSDIAVKLWDIKTGKVVAKWTGHWYRMVCLLGSRWPAGGEWICG